MRDVTARDHPLDPLETGALRYTVNLVSAGEGLVEHCWKYDEIICKIRFHSLIQLCVRMNLHNLSNITEKYQLQIKKRCASKIFWDVFKKTRFHYFFMFFHEQIRFHDFLNIWSSYSTKSKKNRHSDISVIFFNCFEIIWAKIRAIEKSSYFRCRFCDHLSYVAPGFLFTQCIARHFT